MEKVRIVTIESLSEEQVREDMAMTSVERLEVAFRLSDLAVEIQHKSEKTTLAPSSIQWIELKEASPR